MRIAAEAKAVGGVRSMKCRAGGNRHAGTVTESVPEFRIPGYLVAERLMIGIAQREQQIARGELDSILHETHSDASIDVVGQSKGQCTGVFARQQRT